MEGTDVVTRVRARKVVLPASLLQLSGVALAVDEALLPHSLRSSCLALQGVSSPTRQLFREIIVSAELRAWGRAFMHADRSKWQSDYAGRWRDMDWDECAAWWWSVLQIDNTRWSNLIQEGAPEFSTFEPKIRFPLRFKEMDLESRSVSLMLRSFHRYRLEVQSRPPESISAAYAPLPLLQSQRERSKSWLPTDPACNES